MTRDELTDKINQQAREVFLQDGEHCPMVLLFKDMNPVALVDVRGLMKDNETKDRLVPEIRKLIDKLGADLAVFIAEAWAYRSSLEGKKDHTLTQIMSGEIAVSELRPEDKQEHLLVNVETDDGARTTYMHPILRDGDKVDLGPVDKVEGPSKGRLGGFFEQMTIPEPIVQSLRAGMNEVALKLFGRSLDDAFSTKTCVACGGPATEFKTPLFEKKYAISAMCQDCQEKMMAIVKEHKSNEQGPGKFA